MWSHPNHHTSFLSINSFNCIRSVNDCSQFCVSMSDASLPQMQSLICLSFDGTWTIWLFIRLVLTKARGLLSSLAYQYTVYIKNGRCLFVTTAVVLKLGKLIQDRYGFVGIVLESATRNINLILLGKLAYWDEAGKTGLLRCSCFANDLW